MLMVVRFDICTEPIHEINAIFRFAVGFEVQEYRRFADIASWVLHDGDRANLLNQQGEVLSVARLQVTKAYGRYTSSGSLRESYAHTERQDGLTNWGKADAETFMTKLVDQRTCRKNLLSESESGLPQALHTTQERCSQLEAVATRLENVPVHEIVVTVNLADDTRLQTVEVTIFIALNSSARPCV